MYEAKEHWNEYQKKKQTQQELDKLINKLVKKNGTTKYQYERFQYNKKER